MDTSARQTFSWVTGEVQPLHSECPATAIVKWLVGSLVPEKFKASRGRFEFAPERPMEENDVTGYLTSPASRSGNDTEW
ncbi:uncharacterized protein PADG_12117 [Paracoccidioides brasiliensis Pb18]|uniref:Uncharacterized protein n=1 Tax=Paracoccidioides brasiliensis (strain Pb18) TaxID=502780 RepID=A0A0A0HT32_PARBD|nr:uncharacterized protein PADG_12117 [Paracoccidioides brasiliensis Pb18]KGM91802.1 hypothetical protein PADG_12117 [Paracoccidioides brasiliensis Pb18]